MVITDIAGIAGIAYCRLLVPAPCMYGSGLSRTHPSCHWRYL